MSDRGADDISKLIFQNVVSMDVLDGSRELSFLTALH